MFYVVSVSKGLNIMIKSEENTVC